MRFIKTLLCCVAITLAACSGNSGDGNNGIGPEFLKMTDQQRVAKMMEITTPDSVARFIIDASLGKVKNAKIDTLALAPLYAYENYTGDDLVNFSQEFDDYSASLSLSDKMKIYAMLAKVDADQMGYQLGLEYVGYIRQHQMNAKQVAAEIEEFKKACGNDKETYSRFVKGFKAALDSDKGVDIPKEVYEEFKNMSAD